MIKKFNPQIYPCDLYVAVESSIDEILEQLNICDRADFHKIINIDTDKLKSNIQNCDAVTIPVANKKSKTVGILIFIPKIKIISNRTIAHESVHATDYVFDLIRAYSQGFDAGNEPYAYLVDWIFSKVKLTIKCYKNGNKRSKR